MKYCRPGKTLLPEYKNQVNNLVNQVWNQSGNSIAAIIILTITGTNTYHGFIAVTFSVVSVITNNDHYSSY